MGITKLKVSNFKSFDELEVELRPLNIVIGANAAGKSNFLEIFKFLRDLKESGLENAVSLQRGIGYLANLKTPDSRPVSVQICSGPPEGSAPGPLVIGVKNGEILGVKILESTYRLELSAASQATADVVVEAVDHRCEVLTGSLWDSSLDSMTSLGEGKLLISTRLRHIERSLYLAGEEVILSSWFGSTDLAENHGLLLGGRLAPLPRIGVFDFDPSLSKVATPITGRAELDSDGGNLPIVLKGILNDREKAARLSRLVKDILPFVEGVRVESLADKSLLFLLQESYCGRDFLPAPFLSSGTIHVIALIIAVYFDQADLTIIEEPERNIHPHLISRLVEMMRDVSTEAHQIVTTTHNPELIKHADLDDLLLVQRDENGFSHVSRPAENAELKVFLENELGIDELYVQDLLGVGHGV